LKPELLDQLVESADKNNQDKNFPLTVVKVVDYLEDNETVNRERVYLEFGGHVLPEFKEKTFEFFTKAIESEFEGRGVSIARSANYVEFWGVGDQISRKAIAPMLEPIVEAFNEYYYSSAADLFVKREFLKRDESVERAAEELGIELSTDKEGRLNNITFGEVKQLLGKLGLSAMSMPEYWNILKEAEEAHDQQMIAHLKSPGFVEMTDTVIVDKEYMIKHPEAVKSGDDYEFKGEKINVNIPEGTPGLIDPAEIDLETGFPKVVESPHRYGDKTLWRYWMPDAPLCIPTRGFIFLLGQPCHDSKIHPDDALPCLGIRPCRKRVEPPVVEIVKKGKGLEVKISNN